MITSPVMFLSVQADFDFGDDRHDGPRDRVLRVLRVAGTAVLVVAALAILYLAFHPPSGHPTASVAPATPSASATAGQSVAQTSTVRPAAIPPKAPTSAPAPSASPSASPSSPAASASAAAGPLGGPARSYLAGRRGRTEVAVYDLTAGRQWTLGPQEPQAEASVVNLEILQAVMHQREVRRTVLSLTEQELTPPMIEQSDADAAAAMWRDVGGVKGMRAFDHAARLLHTTPATPALTSTTPQDQITLLRQIVQPSTVLDARSRQYVLRLMENVIPEQRWGISSGVPAGVTVALKNGATAPGAGRPGWQVNSVGVVSGGGRRYLMAMLSSGNPSEQYGIDTLDHLGALAWNAFRPG